METPEAQYARQSIGFSLFCIIIGHRAIPGRKEMSTIRKCMREWKFFAPPCLLYGRLFKYDERFR